MLMNECDRHASLADCGCQAFDRSRARPLPQRNPALNSASYRPSRNRGKQEFIKSLQTTDKNIAVPLALSHAATASNYSLSWRMCPTPIKTRNWWNWWGRRNTKYSSMNETTARKRRNRIRLRHNKELSKKSYFNEVAKCIENWIRF